MTGCLISQGMGQLFVVEMIAADHDALCANAGEFFSWQRYWLPLER